MFRKLQHPRLRLISDKNETTAALMASAAAKLNGGLGVCLATSGTGAANLLNGLADAKSDRVPVLAITGQVASFNLGTNYKQSIDHNLLMVAVAQYSGLVAVPDSCQAATNLSGTGAGIGRKQRRVFLQSRTQSLQRCRCNIEIQEKPEQAPVKVYVINCKIKLWFICSCPFDHSRLHQLFYNLLL